MSKLIGLLVSGGHVPPIPFMHGVHLIGLGELEDEVLLDEELLLEEELELLLEEELLDELELLEKLDDELELDDELLELGGLPGVSAANNSGLLPCACTTAGTSKGNTEIFAGH